MGVLLLAKKHHQDVALSATAIVLIVSAGAIRELDLFYCSIGTRREVRFVSCCHLHSPSFSSSLCSSASWFYQRDEHPTEQNNDREISAANAVTGFRHCLLHNLVDTPSSPTDETPVPDQELQAALAPSVVTAAAIFRPSLMIQILANPVVSPCAPTPAAADPDEISVVMSQRALDRTGIETPIQTRTTSRPTTCLSFWLLLLFSSSVHGITYNCINKTYPSSSCCSGEITLDPTMTTIAAHAFDGCSGLNGSLIIPSSVTIIFYAAFQGCSGFTGSLIFPSSLTFIDTYAFYHCYGFTGSLTIPSSVTTIGIGAFTGCSGFNGSLTLPSSVTSISNHAFYGCSGFTSAVTFPNSVTTVGRTPFYLNRCQWLSCCSSCTLTGAQMCQCDSSCNGICQTTFFPTQQPVAQPSHMPTFAPTVLVKYGFGVIFGDSGILNRDQAILVSFYRDLERSESTC
jgi:hypothetical protein